jgi:hypothetical protein
MSRSGYTDDIDDQWQRIMWRGAVTAATKGARGQAFLKEMLAALDGLPEKKLISGELEEDGAVCALGAVGKARGLDMANLDPEDSERVAAKFGIAPALAREIVFMNDEGGFYNCTPEQRYVDMRRWIESQITSAKAEGRP